MIDFRYHLVSLIAVFLAIALGIIIGTTQLNQPILSNVKSQVTALEQDKRDLEATARSLQSQLQAEDGFVAAVAPSIVEGALTGRKVLLVLTSDQVAGSTTEQVTKLVGEAGGTVTGTIRLQPQYSDPGSSASLQSYVTGPGRPSGIELPETDDAEQLVAALLAQVLMIPHEGTAPNAAAASSVLAGLEALDVLSVDSPQVMPADYAIVLTSGNLQGDKNAEQRNAALIDLAAALDAAGSGAVVAGDTQSALDAGLVGVLRDKTDVSNKVSTVDNVDTAAGQVSTVLALGKERQGTSGKYGSGSGAQPAPSLPTP